MRIPRFFCRPEDRQGEVLTLPGAEARHAVTVLRLAPGARIAVLDGTGLEHEAVVTEAGASGAGEPLLRARVVASRPRATEPSLELILLQGLPKGDKLDLVVQKATELGVSQIIPVLTERGVARPKAERVAGKTARWQRIALEAAKQAGRGVVPDVLTPRPLADALQALPSGCLLIVPWEAEQRRTLAEAAATITAGRPVAVAIGPEGGFAGREIALLEEAGAVTVTLGPRTLRTETAGLVALSCLLYATHNLE